MGVSDSVALEEQKIQLQAAAVGGYGKICDSGKMEALREEGLDYKYF